MKAKPAPLNAPMKTTEVKPIPAPEAKPSPGRSSENAPQSLIGAFLSQDIPNIVAEQENAIARL